MEIKRPGEASVQYGDVRGEAAADIADDLGGLDAVSKMLGFKVKGTVVGIRMFSGEHSTGNVYVTLQVFEGGSWGEIKAALEVSGGALDVTEYYKDDVPLVDFIRCFKRLNVGLFGRDSGVREVRIAKSKDA